MKTINYFLIFISIPLFFVTCKDDEEMETAPKYPVENVSVIAGIRSVELSWSRPQGSIQSYLITYLPDEGAVLVEDPDRTTAIISNLRADVEYTFSIAWLNRKAQASPVTTITATPLPVPKLIFEGDMVFTKQAELDALTAFYTDITGDLVIGGEGSDITDLSALATIREITGSLVITSNSNLSELKDLTDLVSIQGSVIITNNASLINYCALRTALTEYDGQVTIEGNSYNPTKAQILSDGCKADDIVFKGDLVLETQADVDAIKIRYTKITGRLKIGNYKNGNITDLSILSNVRSVDFLEVDGNSQLKDLSGLNSLDSIVTGNLTIRDNLKITSLKGLEGLSYMRNDIAILNNPELTTLAGIDNLEAVDEIFIGKEGFNGPTGAEKPNPKLVDYCALKKLVTINLTKLQSNRSVITANAFNPGFQEIVNGNCKTDAPQELVLDGGLRVNTQAEVDALPEYTEITGELVIGLDAATNNITDLSRFSKLKKIGGRFLIQRNTVLTSLSAFRNLTSVGAIAGMDVGELVIRENPLLTSLEGLESLTFIGDDFGVLANNNLTTLKGIENLENVQNRIFIGYQGWQGLGGTVMPNPKLTDYCALAHVIESITVTALENRQCTINNGTFFSPSFQDVLDGNCSESGDLVLDGGLRVNTQAEVDALPMYTEITGELVIGLDAATNNITDLSRFSKLKKIGGRFLIQRNTMLTSLSAFSNLTSVGAIAGMDVGELVIRDNPMIESLEGLENLKFIGDDFGVLNNAELRTLKGIENLANVQNRIFVGYQGWQGLSGTVMPNPKLTDYCALANIIESLTVSELQNRACTINNGAFFSPLFQDILDGNCKEN